jgi:periplasmic protein TonB
VDVAAVRRISSLPTGIIASIGLHLLAVLFLVVTFTHPQSLAPPVDLANAISISMEPFRPKPPPKPPKEPPKPQTPKNVIATTAPEPDVQVAAAPAEPSPPAEPEQATAPGAPSYASIVAGILQRNKRYPRDALLSDQTGVVRVYFVINHQGRVIAFRIEEGSGIASLDDEARSLLRRVKFPPIPDDGGDAQRREFALPIVFSIAG